MTKTYFLSPQYGTRLCRIRRITLNNGKYEWFLVAVHADVVLVHSAKKVLEVPARLRFRIFNMYWSAHASFLFRFARPACTQFGLERTRIVRHPFNFDLGM